ncbi:sigma-B regulation protein RsbQ [Pedobacter sp. UYEF25]
MAILSTHNLSEEFPVLVFLHYFGGSDQSWQWIINELEGEFRCVALNFPGFGNCGALKLPSIKGFAAHIINELKSLDINNYVVVGHSMGAKIAVQMAVDDKLGNIAQLILIAPSPPGVEPIEEAEKNRILHHPNRLEAKKTIENITRKCLSEVPYKLALDNNITADNTTWRWWILEGMNDSIEDAAKTLKLPIAIINSQDDPVVTPKLVKKSLLNVWPEAKLITTSSLGHLMPLENPGWIADQIRILMSQKIN